jgi:hypothetical protein
MTLQFLANVFCSSVSFYVNVTHRYCLLTFCGKQITFSFLLISPGARCVTVKKVKTVQIHKLSYVLEHSLA